MSYTELKASNPKARKDYSCEWCAEKIIKGEKHFQRTYIFDGDFNNGRMHLECESAMYEIPRDYLEDGWTPGDYARGKTEPRGY